MKVVDVQDIGGAAGMDMLQLLDQPVMATSLDVDRSPLTRGMIDILNYTSLGYSKAQIAEMRFTSEFTVNSHSRMMYKRFDVHTASHAVRLGFEFDYLQPREGIELVDTLTPGEAEALTLTSFGLTAPNAADLRGTAYHTIKNQRRFLHKMGAINMPEAVRVGFETGLLQASIPHQVPVPKVVSERLPKAPPQISDGLLPLIASGVTMAKISQLFGRPMASEAKALLDEFDARNLAHAVRIAHRLGRLSTGQSVDASVSLPPRQLAELQFASFGLGTAEAAEITGRAENTHKNHRRVLRLRLAASDISMAGVVHRGFETGLLSVEDTSPIPELDTVVAL